MNLRLDKFISLLSKECIVVAISDTPDYESEKLLGVRKLESGTEEGRSFGLFEILLLCSMILRVFRF